MFEELAKKFSKEMLTLSQGKLHCLPYSRALLDFFEARGKVARPLVVRGVIFGCPKPATPWKELNWQGMIREAIGGPRANGAIVAKYTPEGATQSKEVTVPYRTIGFPHSGEQGDKTLGNFEDGKWLGHLVVLVDNTVIDLTIGQLNHDTFAINFDPHYAMIEADENFLAGKSPLVGEQDGMLICYFAFPDEKTHENSESWNDPAFRHELKKVGNNVAKCFEGKPDTDFHIQPS